MSTPEELTLIRHVIHHRELRYADKERELTDALIAVLRDAERFKALERENDTNQSDYHCRWCFWHKNLGYHIHEAKLAELADRLREEAQ